MHKLIDIVEGFAAPRIVVLGDYMLDCYVYGDAERISPESPVPVLNVVRSESRCGGAGNVAVAVAALGGRPICVGLSGKDAAGEELATLLGAAGAQTAPLLKLADRRTTVKTRHVGLAQHRHAQQMLRVDSEDTAALSDELHNTLRAAVRGELADCALLAIEDYGKGALDDLVTPQIIADARAAGVGVLVDPARSADYARYRGATLLTPNRFETEQASGIKITDADSLHRAARQVRNIAQADAVLVKLDKEGAYLLAGDEGRMIPTRARSVYDVTGAGDIVLATLAVALAQGVELSDAAALANIAGGLEVERFGVVPIARTELIDELHRMIGLRGGKVMSRDQLAEHLARRRARGEAVVFTNGCFDLLHMGHVRYLQQARELGSCLVVAINADESVRRLKGPGRPIIGAGERAEMLAALECVDYVTIFDEDTPIPLLELLKPELLVKGGTTPSVVGQELVEGYGGKVRTLSAVDGLSTTQIIESILNGSRPG